MNIEDILEIYKTISVVSERTFSRKCCLVVRSSQLEAHGLVKCAEAIGFKKVAFDTRRVDQEEQYNPRRNLRNYHRSEAFVSDDLSDKLKLLHKLQNVLLKLKSVFGKDPDWHDSYSRILLSNITNALRTNENDGDYAETQPGVGSMDYIKEMLYFRYRLTYDDIANLTDEALGDAILHKDEKLTKKDMPDNRDLVRNSDSNRDPFIDKFSGLMDIREDIIERVITITIKDKRQR